MPGVLIPYTEAGHQQSGMGVWNLDQAFHLELGRGDREVLHCHPLQSETKLVQCVCVRCV